MARGRTVSEIAEDLGADVDEVLVTLWDGGIEEFEDGDDIVPNRRLRAVEKALGVVTHKQRLNVDYWLQHAGVSRQQLAEALSKAGLRLSPGARRIPKGSLKKLTRLFPEQPPITEPEEFEEPPPIPLRWEVIGAERLIRALTAEEVAAIHRALEEDFANAADPIVPPGVRDWNLLGSAASRAQTSFGNHRKYPTVEMASAALFHSVVHNHAFFNGNKRTALVSLLAQLDENDMVLTATEKDLSVSP